MQPSVQLEMHVLGERLRTFVAAVGLVVRVQSLVRLQVGGGRESLSTVSTSMRFLACATREVKEHSTKLD